MTLSIMLVRIYTIIALLNFIILISLNSTVELAIIKSGILFIALLLATKLSKYLLQIIKETQGKEKESTTSQSK